MAFRSDDAAEKKTDGITHFYFASPVNTPALTACHIRTIPTMMAHRTQYGCFFIPSV